ncbi:hypothetical protein CH282_19655 [Rhodococcus sp. 06-418-1B]|nr:hypothetical protein [Rhodococcus sp. 06-418-1B]OZC79870.1 hypothetical protein CH282_19655 [Rhodococcus sp. 06-418-1B]
MNDALLRADRRTKDFFGGPGLGVIALVVVVAVAVPVVVSSAGWSTFGAAAVVYAVAIVAATLALAIRRGAGRSSVVAAGGAAAIAILFVVGYTGIFSMSDDVRWSGSSAVTGMVLGSLVLGLLVRRGRDSR